MNTPDLSDEQTIDEQVIDGLHIEPVPDDERAGLLESLTGAAGRAWPPSSCAPVWWVHIEQPNGYVVGRFHDGTWTLAGPDGRRIARLDGPWNQIRVFQPGHELIVFHHAGRTHGSRRLRTSPTGRASTGPRERTLMIERTAAPPGPDTVFPVIRDPLTQLTAVIPEPRAGTVPVTMRVREHFTADPHSGAVRVAAVCWDRYEGGVSDPILAAHATTPPPATPSRRSLWSRLARRSR